MKNNFGILLRQGEQAALAQKMGVHRQYMSKLMHDEYYLDGRDLKRRGAKTNKLKRPDIVTVSDIVSILEDLRGEKVFIAE